jgi:very-short-patch-repair endonuclease
MPGSYVRTDKHRKLASKVMKRRWKENYEQNLKATKQWIHDDPERKRKIGSEVFKKLWREKRSQMVEIAKKASNIGNKLAWKNDHERMARISAGNLNRWRKEHPRLARKHALEICKMNGANGHPAKNITDWMRNNKKEHLDMCSRNGKKVAQRMRKLFPSPIEAIVRTYLNKMKIGHKDNVWFSKDGIRKEADIVVPKYNLIIECDGFWHNRPEAKAIDKFKNNFFNSLGYDVIRLKSTEIRNGKFKGAIDDKFQILDLTGGSGRV